MKKTPAELVSILSSNGYEFVKDPQDIDSHMKSKKVFIDVMYNPFRFRINTKSCVPLRIMREKLLKADFSVSAINTEETLPKLIISNIEER